LGKIFLCNETMQFDFNILEYFLEIVLKKPWYDVLRLKYNR
jgi:hypothetical protein